MRFLDAFIPGLVIVGPLVPSSFSILTCLLKLRSARAKRTLFMEDDASEIDGEGGTGVSSANVTE